MLRAVTVVLAPATTAVGSVSWSVSRIRVHVAPKVAGGTRNVRSTSLALNMIRKLESTIGSPRSSGSLMASPLR